MRNQKPDLFIAAIVKGIKELNDATAFFGALGGFNEWAARAIEEGYIKSRGLTSFRFEMVGDYQKFIDDKDGDGEAIKYVLTQRGEELYVSQDLGKYRHCRAYFWKY